ncbi:MAG: hypothetical protein WCK59_01260 [Candidatus Falkowbacteria bacterium]
MLRVSEKYLPIDKSTPRDEEKYLPIDRSPQFDEPDDLDNEEFVHANDPKRKFLTADKVPNTEDDEENEVEISTEDDEENEIEPSREDDEEDYYDTEKALHEVRGDIKNYDYQHRGPKDVGNLESFHIDHDTESITAVVGDGPVVKEGKLDDSLINEEGQQDKPLRRGVNMQFIPQARKMYDQRQYIKQTENLKTLPDNKVQRSNRGLIRKFFDNFAGKN